jgi:hypothetical protein
MKLLLEIATVKTHFIFNDNLYCQIEGIAMGSPLRPVFADIFMIHLEKQLMTTLKNNCIPVSDMGHFFRDPTELNVI